MLNFGRVAVFHPGVASLVVDFTHLGIMALHGKGEFLPRKKFSQFMGFVGSWILCSGRDYEVHNLFVNPVLKEFSIGWFQSA